jgi:hypothetical protein
MGHFHIDKTKKISLKSIGKSTTESEIIIYLEIEN